MHIRVGWRRLIGAAVTALLALAVPGAFAATATLVPVDDTTIYQGVDPVTSEDFEVNSCGAGSNLFAGVTNDGLLRRALLRFDIAGSIPAGSTINSVTLTIDVDRSGDNQDSTMTLSPILDDWGEGAANCDSVRGGGQGVPADPGDATWLDAMFQQTAWGTPGGDSGAISGSAVIGTRGVFLWDSTAPGNDGMVDDVQSWLDSSATNFGWIVVGEEARSSTTRRFSSVEGQNDPVLTVDFTPVGDVFACCFDDGACSVTDTISCSGQGGTPDTSTNSCSPNPCPQPQGACCNVDESCSDDVARDVCEAAGGTFEGAGSACSQGSVDCGLEPFVDPLPIPAVLQPVSTRPDGVPQYEVTMTEEQQILHRDLPATDVWTYNGTFPGPTIEATLGQPVEVKYTNSLPNTGQRRGGHYLEVDECAHGPNYWQDTARAVVHLHGGHVPARVDGNPEYDFLPGEFDTYEYPNNQLPATLWYHDHALGITRLNVYMGMAAFYLIRDGFETALGLPAGNNEIPLVLQDREFNPDGSFFYPPTIQDAFFGDKLLVNGKVWPYLDVDRGKYRFRFLNGSQARVYKLRLENLADPAQVIPFQLIGTDGGLIDAPIPLDTITMAPAERFDVVVDFGAFPVDSEIVLRNDGPGGPSLPNVMKFVVQAQTGHTANLPATLRPVTPIPEGEATVTRWFNLVRKDEPCSGGEWLIETLDGPDPATANVLGSHWDDISEFPTLGTTEIWEFVNSSNLMHPMHVHLVMFQVLDRVDLTTGQPKPLDPWEINTWKDTVRVPANHRVRVIARFENYLGRFPYHCHILDHEDHEMMRQFQTTNDPADCNVNGICEAGEDCVSCADCGTASGALCGNGLCEIGDGEDCISCPDDCAGKQKGSASRQYCCGDGDGNGPVSDCGYDADGFTLLDDRCTTGGFYCRIAPRVAACCGDMLCEGEETDSSCALDCGGAPPPQCTDNDGDGFAVEGGDCGPVDCNDNDANVNPGATEVCNDGIDNDCDDLIDAADPDCQVADCSSYTDAQSCRNDSNCRWNKRAETCVNK
jgi:spore coat protein A